MSSHSSTVFDEPARPLTQIEPRLPALSGASARTRLLVALFAAVALIPVVCMLWFAQSNARNVPYFDEIDTAIALLLHLDSRPAITELLGQLVAVNNEHRMFTSRLLFVLSYVFTGSIDFVWIAAIGNCFILVACAILLRAVADRPTRLILGVVLAFSLFHFGHYENFLWSGASIDHFQVVTLAVGSFVALQRGSRVYTALGTLGAILASFTLAHGLVAWPVGALMLARDRRWRALAGWSTVAVLTGAIFLAGFHVNPGHRIGAAGLGALPTIVAFWLHVLGAPLAFGHAAAAKILGAVLMAIAIAQTMRGHWRRDRETLPTLWFIIGAAFLVALGRAAVSEAVASRYFVLGAIGWGLVAAEIIRRVGSGRRAFAVLACVVPVLAAFNLAHNLRFRGDALTFLEHRDRAALKFRQHGEDGRAIASLHPLPRHSTRVLALAEQRGVYQLPPLCELRHFPNAAASERITYYVDEFSFAAGAVAIAGWVTVPDHALKRGEIHLMLRSDTTTCIFTTVPLRRPDVVKAYGNPGWEFSGFRAAIRRDRIPRGDYQVGFLVAGTSPAEYVLSDHRLHLSSAGRVTFHK